MESNESKHKTVLLNETIEGLSLNDNSIVLDCTFGGGGHTLEVCKRHPKAKIIALDQDKGAWKKAKSKFKGMDCDITFINTNFSNLKTVLEKKGINQVNGIIFDLGLSSDQLETSGRGFSFLRDEPLLMTMKENPAKEDLTAEDIVNTWAEESIADVIYGYGEERLSRRIAKAIVEARKKEEIKTTFQLVKIIEDAVPGFYKRGRIHFATRTFQALRIAVNDELRVLQSGLDQGFDLLATEGRMSVITFHSLEDRIVKRFFQEKVKDNESEFINKKPILASIEELRTNPRARSAKLRVIKKIR